MCNDDGEAIYTDGRGVPIPRPSPDDFPTTIGYMRAVWAWRDKIADVANQAFTEQFRKSLKRNK